MGIDMNTQLHIPDIEIARQLLSNLHRSRLDVAEIDVKIEDLLNRLEDYSHQQRLNRVQ
jgi:hypothetical protein